MPQACRSHRLPAVRQPVCSAPPQTPAQVAAALKKGNPAIYARDHYANVGILQIDPRPLLSGQVQQIIKGLKEILIVK